MLALAESQEWGGWNLVGTCGQWGVARPREAYRGTVVASSKLHGHVGVDAGPFLCSTWHIVIAAPYATAAAKLPMGC